MEIYLLDHTIFAEGPRPSLAILEKIITEGTKDLHLKIDHYGSEETLISVDCENIKDCGVLICLIRENIRRIS